MKPLASFLLTAASVLPMFTAAQFDGFVVNGKPLDISGRFSKGLLTERVKLIHTTVINGQPEFHKDAHDANVAALRKHELCATKPSQCVAREGTVN